MSIENVKYGFYTSVNRDRIYDNTDFSRVLSAVINDGVFAHIGDKLAVTPSSGMTVRVGTGRAWFNDTWTSLETAGYLTLTSSRPNMGRIDAVVLTVDKSQRMNSIGVIEGTPSANPVKPSMASGSDDIFNYPLAYITVPAGATAVSNANIEIAVPSTTPYVTGPMQVADMSYLFAQWGGQFSDWFTHLNDELNEHQAANLQRQIDEIQSEGLEKLAVARLIDGVAFDGSKNINHLATSTTAAGTADKVASLTGYSLAVGSWAVVKFSNTNTANLNSVTLNINSTGAKPIRYRGSVLEDQIEAGLYFVIYDGTNYEIIGGGIGSKKNTFTANRVLVSGADGLPTQSEVTSTELAGFKNAINAKAPLASPAFTGTPTVAANSTSGAMLRNIYISTANPSGTVPDGSIWIKYKA